MTPNPNARTKLYLNIRSHLRDSGLKFFERARERQFLLLMRSDALTLHQLITIHKDGIKFRIETKLPLVVPAHRRVAVLELAARLNCITDRGHFDVNVDTGDMQYRVDCDALVSLVVRPALLSVLARSLDPVVRARPLIEEVMLHDVDPKTVMEKFRKKVQDRAGENARNAAIARRRAERERDRNPGQPGHGRGALDGERLGKIAVAGRNCVPKGHRGMGATRRLIQINLKELWPRACWDIRQRPARQRQRNL